MYCMREEVNQTQLVGFNVFGIGSEETSWAAVVKNNGVYKVWIKDTFGHALSRQCVKTRWVEDNWCELRDRTGRQRTDGQTCSSSIRLCNTSRLLLLNWWKPWEGMAWAKRQNRVGSKQKTKKKGGRRRQTEGREKNRGKWSKCWNSHVNWHSMMKYHRHRTHLEVQDRATARQNVNTVVIHVNHSGVSHLWGDLSSVFQPGELGCGRSWCSAVQPQGFTFVDSGILGTDLDLGLRAEAARVRLWPGEKKKKKSSVLYLLFFFCDMIKRSLTVAQIEQDRKVINRLSNLSLEFANISHNKLLFRSSQTKQDCSSKTSECADLSKGVLRLMN